MTPSPLSQDELLQIERTARFAFAACPDQYEKSAIARLLAHIATLTSAPAVGEDAVERVAEFMANKFFDNCNWWKLASEPRKEKFRIHAANAMAAIRAMGATK